MVAILETVEISNDIPGQNKSAVRMPCSAPNRAIEGQSREALSRIEVPDRHGVVLGPRDDAPAVGAHRHGPHPTLMSGKPVNWGTGFEVPDRHGVVLDPETMRRPSGLTATDRTQP